MSLKGIAKATLSIIEKGGYTAPSGSHRSIASDLVAAREGTILFEPEALVDLLDQTSPQPQRALVVDVVLAKTQQAARRLVQDEQLNDLVLLNFASARNVSGGFINGAKAQEEDIARCSGIYACLLTQPAFYTRNRVHKSLLYTDHIIYTPQVPFFRANNRDVLEHPYLASVITAPAPNAGQHLRRDPNGAEDIEETLRARAGYVLAVAQEGGHRSLLLGAWGCGVFMNTPSMVADAFGQWLESDRFLGAFDHVTFAVYDRSRNQSTFNAFVERFS